MAEQRETDSQEDAWVVGVGDRVIRMVGITPETIRSLLHEAFVELIDSARITIRPMTDSEREAELDIDEGEETPPSPNHR